ncbi:MAG: PepSY domain-containing protein [Leptospirillia bacterium]
MLRAMALANDRLDHERARALVEAGEILSLEEILKKLFTRYEGNLLETELEEEDGVIVYEIELLRSDGQVVELFFDARSGELIKTKAGD